MRIVLKIAKWLGIVVAAVVALLLLVPVALYVPFVQDFVKDIAVREVSKATGYDISVERIRLRWPLRLSVDDALIVEQTGDTMLMAQRLDLGVGLRPLFRGDVEIDYARLDSARYQLGNADSLMWLRASVDHFEMEASRLKMNLERVDLDRALLDGARINLAMRPDTAVNADTAASKLAMVIRARDIELRRVDYTMTMLPTIDTLRASVPSARLSDGLVDLGRRRVNARLLRVDSVAATYLTPSAAWLKAHPVAVAPETAPTPDSLMWTVTADSLRLTATDLLYAVSGARPAPGLDMNYLRARYVTVDVDSFSNRGPSVGLTLRRLLAEERCGLRVDASGRFDMADGQISASGFRIFTDASTIGFDADMGLTEGADMAAMPLRLKADARIGLSDVVRAFPALGPTVRSLPAPNELSLRADVAGTMADMTLRRLDAAYPGLLKLAVSGRVRNITDFNRMAGKLTVDGEARGLNRVKTKFLAASTASEFNIPELMTVKGTVDYRPAAVDGDITLTANSGRIAAKGRWERRAEGYMARLTATDFPVDAFVTKPGIGSVTARVDLSGHGYNPLKPSTQMKVDIDIDRIVYNSKSYGDITLLADLGGRRAAGRLHSGIDVADLDADFDATLGDSAWSWDVDGDIRHLDLMALGLSKEANAGTMMLATTGVYNPLTRAVDGRVSVDRLTWLTGTTTLCADSTVADVAVDAAGIRARVAQGDLLAVASTKCPLESIMPRIDATMLLVDRLVKAKKINIDSLQRALPPMSLSLEAGRNNIVSEYLAGADNRGPQFRQLALTASTDSLINIIGKVTGFSTGSTRLDTIRLTAVQHGGFLVYNAQVSNAPGTMDDFARVTLNGYLGENRLGALLRQSNIKGESGYRIGLGVTTSDSVATLRLVPYNPMIAYRQWEVNDSNYVSYNFVTRQISADLRLHNDKSSVAVATLPPSGDATMPGQDISVKLNDVLLQDWMSVNPFATPMTGSISADLLFHWDRENLTGRGNVSLADMTYNRQRVGNFDLDIDMANDPLTGHITADMALMVDSVKTVTIKGILNDSTTNEPFNLDLSMIHFPLKTANAFLPPGTAKLEGTLNGSLLIKGNAEKPFFDGWLAFDSATVTPTILGTQLKLSESRITVDSCIARFNDFTVTGCNDNPLKLNGTVDLRNLANASYDLSLKADNMMIVNSQRPRGANIYGKAYISLDATARGNMKLMMLNADASLLAGTNATYLMTSAGTQIPGAASADDIVKFVQFNDSTGMAADSIIAEGMTMIINAALSIEQGTTLNVDLSASGQNKVSIQGYGDFDYSMTPANADGRLTGRFTIDKGFVRYTPPMMSEKLFDFNQGSYVNFTGNIMNPTLNVSAVDKVKANVTRSGEDSRLVTFDITASVTNTLENLNVAFDMSTVDDIGVENELRSMSPEQRANQAMNLLLYNVYTGPGSTVGKASLNGNPLFSYLESQINSWAANNIKGVDLSFGIKQYDRTRDGATSTATSYSYRISKSFLNDRIKIVVGGNYTTDASADENFAENLLNDISFEYMLNKSGSMYIRLFRTTGYESILEGEVTQTGVGFVLRRKIDSLRHLFRRPKENKEIPVADEKP